MLILKDASVLTTGLKPEIFFALGVASALKSRMFDQNCIVTSLTDGHHNDGSLHPLGLACDLRTNDMTIGERIAWFEALKAALEPSGFDIVWEGGVGATPATTGAHVHIEFDAKGRKFWHYLQGAI